MKSITTVGVVGSGQMGSGIAHVAASAGLSVLLADTAPEILVRARAAIEKNMDREIAKGKRTAEEKAAALLRIRETSDLSALSGADLVIEAVTENLGVKRELFGRLDAIVPSDGLLATNTSSISITALAASTSRPDRFIGMHFMNPVPVMALVEVIRGIATSDETRGGDRGPRPENGEDADLRQRLSRLRVESRADADDQRGDLRPVRRASPTWRRSTGS